MSALAPSLEAYFTDRLVSQRASSPNTIAAYALTFRLLLAFASRRTGSPPSRLDIAELDAPLIAAFLEHLERDRHNAVATRNMRLAAVHSLFSYLALHHPEHAGSIQRVLSIPQKRAESNLITYLVEDEVTALLEACDLRSWTGRRDHAMFALTIQTGLRISELVGLRCENLSLGRGANVHTLGKGERSDAPRSFRARSSSSRRGFANGEELSPTRSFRRVPGGASVAKPSSGDSLATSPWLGQVVLRSLRSA
jgi:site-specific recombinase XerD